jgi:hypothetical protein
MKDETIDVLVSFDTTGSMYPCLTQVRRKAVELVTRLFRDIPGIRMGAIGQGDYCDGKRAITMLDLTSDSSALIDFIKTVPATDGGDSAECYELVLHQARSASWRSGKSKVLVLIGDDVPHAPNYPDNRLRLDWRNERKLLQEAGIHVYAVQALNRSYATPFYREVGELHMVLDQFAHIGDLIMAICYKQVSNERLTQFEEELNTTGYMNRGVDAFISILAGRKGGSTRFTTAAGLNAVPSGRFQVLTVDHDQDIKGFAEDNGLTFKKGRGFYEFTKPVDVQAYKEVILMNNTTGDLFNGDAARDMAAIPHGVTAHVRPGAGTLAGHTCFIQSTSVNRVLKAGTKFLYEVDGWSA